MKSRPGGAAAAADPQVVAAQQGAARLDAAAAFDGAAAEYDAAFSERRLGMLLRGLLHQELARHLPANGLHLECGCGTGLDAAWMLRRGAAVLATDVSPAMRAATIARLRAEVGHDLEPPGASGGFAAPQDATAARRSIAQGARPVTQRGQPTGAAAVASLDLARPVPPLALEYATGDDVRLRRVQAGASLDQAFDGCFSSFGPLNCVLDRRPLAAALQRWLRPGARVCFVIMPRLAPWDWLWYGAHRSPKAALRRLRRAPVADLPGGGKLALDYPSARALDAELGPSFRRLDHRAIGALLPISEAAGLVSRAPLIFEAVAAMEREVAARWPWPHLCDHALHVWERR